MKKKKAEPKKGDSHIDPTNVGGPILGKILGLNSAYVSQLFSKRIIKQNGRRGKYNLYEAGPAYVESIRTSGTAEAGEKLKVAQKEKLEIQNAKERGELVRIDDAAEVFRQACISWRAGASAIPRRMASDISDTAREHLVNEIADLFTEVEKPFSEYFGAGWNSPAPTKPRTKRATPAAKKNARPVGGRKPNPTRRKRGTRKVAK